MAEIELRDVPLFSEMDEEEVAGIREIMDVMKFNPGQVIIREGERGGRRPQKLQWPDEGFELIAGRSAVRIRDLDGKGGFTGPGGPDVNPP